MAYIPPHKRHSNETQPCSPPKPALLKPRFHHKNNNPNLNAQRIAKTAYANSVAYRWFPVGFADERQQFPTSVSLQQVSFDWVDRKPNEKTLALIYNPQEEVDKDCGEVSDRVLKSPWVYIADNVVKYLLSSFENVRREMESCGSEAVTVRPILVARFGKIIFRRGILLNREECVTEDLSCEEDTLRQMKRTFYTSIPKSYMEYILDEGAQKIGVEFEEYKDLYYVQLTDSSRKNSDISCKCRVSKESGKLELHKIELGRVRHMVMDISCLEKNVDLRLMLGTKRIISLTDDDMQSLQNLIASAVVDIGVKGGLRWPLGNSSSGDKFRVFSIWHTTAKSYVNPSMRLVVRNADRFDFTTSTGEASKEINVKLKRVVSELKEPPVSANVKEVLQDDLRVLWDSFLCCESFLKW